MQASRRVGLVAAVATLGVAVLVLVREERRPARTGVAAPTSAAIAAPEASQARPPGLELAPRAEPAVESALATTPAEAAPGPDDRPTLIVVMAGAKPVEGARVIAWPDIEAALAESPPMFEAYTNARGHVEIDGTPATTVFASHPEHGESDMRSLARTKRRTNRFPQSLALRPLVTITGDVLDESARAVAMVTVHAEIATEDETERHEARRSAPRAPAPVVTDANGRFELAARSGSTLTLYAQRGMERSRSATIDTDAYYVPDVVLRFGGLVVTGTLTGPEGAGFTATVKAMRWNQGALLEVVTRAANGRFAFELDEAGTYEIVTAADGLLMPRQVAVRVDHEQPTAHVDLRMIPAATITGLVTRDGAPVEAFVRAVPYTRAGDVDGIVPTAMSDRAPTNGEGRFTIGGVHPDALYDLEVRNGESQLTGRALAVRPGADDVHVRLGLPFVSFRVEVVDALTRVPLDESQISFRSHDQRQVSSIPSLAHDGPVAGESAAVGTRYDVTVWCPGYSSRQLEVVAEHGASVVVALERATSLTVTLRDAAGVLLPGVAARLERLSGLIAPAQLGQPTTEGCSDAQGRIVFQDVEPSRYALVATRPEGPSRPVPIEVGPEPAAIDVTLEPAATAGVRVRVEDSGGRPVIGVRVQVARFDDPQARVTAWVDSTGRATLPDVEPGIWILGAWGASHSLTGMKVALPADDEVVLVVPDDALLSVR